MKLTFSLLAILCAVWTNIANADALVQDLPPDGSWITYHVTMKVGAQEVQPIWTVRSVGTKIVDNEPCRWIEMQSLDQDQSTVFKLQIPEKEFGKGKNPFGNAKKVWFKGPNATDAKEFNSLAEIDLPLSIILQGPTTDVKKRDQKEPVKWQSGQFDSDVFEGLNSTELFGNKFELSHIVWKHADVPFGVAAMKQTMKLKLGTETQNASLDMTLKEFGKDAKTALPQVE
jgi:hypothetical protein